MDTGKATNTSIGKKSTEIPTLASESGRAAKPLQRAQTKPVSNNSLETLAELLSLIQEDCRRYSETLAEFLPNQKPVTMFFKGDGIIHLCAPPEHYLDTGNGHILLDGKPVTGWTLADEKKGE